MIQIAKSSPPKLPAELVGTASIVPKRKPAVARDARLRKHADYQRVYHATRKQFSSSMTWFLAARPILLTGSQPGSVLESNSRPNSGPRVGLTVGKVLGKAHERNRIKRRMREAIRHQLHELPDGIDLILHPRRSVITMEFVKLEAEILRIFRQASAQASHAAASAALKPVAGLAVVARPNGS